MLLLSAFELQILFSNWKAVPSPPLLNAGRPLVLAPLHLESLVRMVGDAPGDGIAGWEAVQSFTYQANRSEITGGTLLLLLAVDTGGSCSTPAREAPF